MQLFLHGHHTPGACVVLNSVGVAAAQALFGGIFLEADVVHAIHDITNASDFKAFHSAQRRIALEIREEQALIFISKIGLLSWACGFYMCGPHLSVYGI